MVRQSVFTIKEVADLLRVEPVTIKRYIAQGRMKGFKLPGGQWRIPRTEIDYLLPKGGETHR